MTRNSVEAQLTSDVGRKRRIRRAMVVQQENLRNCRLDMVAKYLVNPKQIAVSVVLPSH